VALGVGKDPERRLSHFEEGGSSPTGSFSWNYAMPPRRTFPAVEGESNGDDQDQPAWGQGGGRRQKQECVARCGGRHAVVNALAGVRGLEAYAMTATPEVCGARSGEGLRPNGAKCATAEVTDKMIWPARVLVKRGQEDSRAALISFRLPDNPEGCFLCSATASARRDHSPTTLDHRTRRHRGRRHVAVKRGLYPF